MIGLKRYFDSLLKGIGQGKVIFFLLPLVGLVKKLLSEESLSEESDTESSDAFSNSIFVLFSGFLTHYLFKPCGLYN